jgi:hypothetical protein
MDGVCALVVLVVCVRACVCVLCEDVRIAGADMGDGYIWHWVAPPQRNYRWYKYGASRERARAREKRERGEELTFCKVRRKQRTV